MKAVQKLVPAIAAQHSKSKVAVDSINKIHDKISAEDKVTPNSKVGYIGTPNKTTIIMKDLFVKIFHFEIEAFFLRTVLRIRFLVFQSTCVLRQTGTGFYIFQTLLGRFCV